MATMQLPGVITPKLLSDTFNFRLPPRHLYKLEILYDNGKPYKVTHVQDHKFRDGYLVYNTVTKTTSGIVKNTVKTESNLSMDHVAAITVVKHDQITMTRYKPCAVLEYGTRKISN